MKKKLIHVSLFLIVAVLLMGAVSFAGSLTPPGSPSKTMKSLADLYQLVNTGVNTPSTDFTTPGTILPTMNTIGDTYDLLKTKITDIDTTKILTGTSIFGKTGTMSAAALLKTNQTTCSIVNGSAQNPCLDGTNSLGGQDGYYQKGVALSYVDNGNGTILDTTTGLMWKQASSSGEDWTSALSTCEADTTAGFTDWRLPNIRELLSIIDYGNIITNTLFNSAPYPYWSSTSYYQYSNYAWLVYFDDGDTTISTKNISTNHYVRCVRG